MEVGIIQSSTALTPGAAHADPLAPTLAWLLSMTASLVIAGLRRIRRV